MRLGVHVCFLVATGTALLASSTARAALTLEQDELARGQTVTMTVTGADPGDVLTFLYSTAGEGPGACPAPLGGICLDIRNPVTVLGTAGADPSGVATFHTTIAADLPLGDWSTQAVRSAGVPDKTNVITAPVCDPAPWYLDGDLDGFGSALDTVVACSPPSGYVAEGTDCDDADPAIGPGATEIWYDGVDQDCDGSDVDGSVYVLFEDFTLSTDQFIGGIVYVVPGATLTIEAGVELSFWPGAGLFVDGILDVQGTSLEPVRFANATSFHTGPSRPLGVWVGDSGDLSSVHDAVFEEVDLYLEHDATSSITDVLFEDSNLEVTWRSTGFTLSNCDFTEMWGADGSRLRVTEVPTLTVTNTTFSGGGDGIHVRHPGGSMTVDISATTLSNLLDGIDISGDPMFVNTVLVDGVEVSDTRNHGIVVDGATATVSNSVVDRTVDHGIRGGADSDLLVLSTTVSNSLADCIHGDSLLTVDDSIIDDCGDDGVQAPTGASILATDISNTTGDGINADHDVVVDDVFVELSTGDGIDALAGLSLTNSTVMNATGACIVATDNAFLSELLVNGCGENAATLGTGAFVSFSSFGFAASHGIELVDGTVVSSLTSVNAGRGINVTGEAPTSIDLCEVTDNGNEGIRGPTGLVNALAVTSSNITGNADWAIREAFDVIGNHIANNNGVAGVDLFEASSGDGSRTLVTLQQENIANIQSPQVVSVGGAGPSS